MRLLLAALLVLSAFPVSPGAAQSPPVSDTAAAPRLERARALLRLTNPPPLMLETNMRGWEAAITQALTLNPTVAALEVEYPGIGKAAIDAARPLARENCQRFVVAASERKSALLAERLSASELDEVIAFFETDTGKRLIDRLIGNVDPAAVGRDVATRASETGQVSLTSEAVQQAERKAIRTTLGETSAADHIAILRFQQKPVAAKYAAAAVEGDRLVLEMVNHLDPAWLSRQTEIINAALLAFVDARKKS